MALDDIKPDLPVITPLDRDPGTVEACSLVLGTDEMKQELAARVVRVLRRPLESALGTAVGMMYAAFGRLAHPNSPLDHDRGTIEHAA